jgi:hypothetical protein
MRMSDRHAATSKDFRPNLPPLEQTVFFHSPRTGCTCHTIVAGNAEAYHHER